MIDPDFMCSQDVYDYVREEFQFLGLPAPRSRETIRRWFHRKRIKTYPHRDWKEWFTKKEWVDEAIRLKRIPPRKGKPPIALRIERRDYVATQEDLL